MSGHPKLNMILLGTSSGLMTASAISGFISHGKLGDDTSELTGAKRILLVASLLALFSAILLIIGIVLIHHHTKKMEPAQGGFSMVLLVLSGLCMLVSAIMYAVAAAELTKTDPNNQGKKYKDTYGTSYTTAVLSAILTLCALGTVGISFLSALIARHKSKRAPVAEAPPVTTQVHQEPSYTDEDGALVQLKQLQEGTGAAASTTMPSTLGTQ